MGLAWTVGGGTVRLMSSRFIVTVALLCFAFQCNGKAEHTGEFETEIQTVTIHPCHQIRSLQFWDGKVVASQSGRIWPLYYSITDLKVESLLFQALITFCPSLSVKINHS